MTLDEAIESGVVGERLWFYTNYHCNLACRYCLTSSESTAPRRELDAGTIIALAEEAAQSGFHSFGVTGGEPFLRPDMPQLLLHLAQPLPVVVLTNGTLFTDGLMRRLARLAALPVALQVSLDSADPAINDAQRGAGTHARVVSGMRRLRDAGIRVRVGTTTNGSDREAQRALCALHRDLGIPDEDHVVRPIIRRGRARDRAAGVTVRPEDLPPELTIMNEGSFYSPASPTVTDGRLDIGELLTRTIRPLRITLAAMLRCAADGVGQRTGLVA